MWGYPLFAILFWLPLGVGLWRLNPIAYKVSVGALWLFTILVPIGLASPFALMEYDSGHLPSTLSLVLKVVAISGSSLLTIYVLSKYKTEFKRP